MCKASCAKAARTAPRNCTLHFQLSCRISSIEEGLDEIRNGRMVILVDEDAPDSDGFLSRGGKSYGPERSIICCVTDAALFT